MQSVLGVGRTSSITAGARRSAPLLALKPFQRSLQSRIIAASTNIDEPEPEPSSSLTSSSTAKPITAEYAQELLSELTDPSQFGERGEGWFLGQAILLLLVAFPPAGIRQIVDVAGWSLLASGISLIIIGSNSLGTNLTPVPKPRDDHSLITDGAYQLCRHPMYGGILLGAAGLALASGDEARVALTALLFWVLDMKAAYEEDLLEERYPGEYAEYKAKTKKFIPWLY